MRTNRRTFLTGLTAPLILGAADKSGSKRPVLGEGTHNYEAIHDRGEVPASIQYGNTHGVGRESRDKFIPGKFVCPHGACFDHDGNTFVVEWVEVGRVTKLRRVA